MMSMPSNMRSRNMKLVSKNWRRKIWSFGPRRSKCHRITHQCRLYNTDCSWNLWRRRSSSCRLRNRCIHLSMGISMGRGRPREALWLVNWIWIRIPTIIIIWPTVACRILPAIPIEMRWNSSCRRDPFLLFGRTNRSKLR